MQAQPPEPQQPVHGVDAQLARPGCLSYLEIPAIDPRKSAAFYAALLGWKIMNADSDQPKFSDPSGNLIGRWIKGRPAAKEPGILPYIYVHGIDDIAARASAHGGELLEAPRPEGNLRVARLRDPAGNVIGIWQAMPPSPSKP